MHIPLITGFPGFISSQFIAELVEPKESKHNLCDRSSIPTRARYWCCQEFDEK
ncbi:hypothetical protein [Paenisporosarcina indica]|uniref:hypothetical protein n=1 Tax=Paenisporosarcina indica TaxID=650093 RepID=UPI000A41BA5F|nr:hypothetical protein [Paenisporosarcina indica]